MRAISADTRPSTSTPAHEDLHTTISNINGESYGPEDELKAGLVQAATEAVA